MSEEEEISLEEALTTITKMRAVLMERVPALTKEREELGMKKADLHKAVEEAQVAYDEAVKPVDERLAVIDNLLTEANIPEVKAPKEGVVTAPGGKKKIAMDYLSELAEGTVVRPTDVAVAANYTGGAAGAFTKQMVTQGYLKQPGGKGTPYTRTGKAIP